MALKSGSKKVSSDKNKTGTWKVKAGLAQMLKGGVIMDVVTSEHAKIAEDGRSAIIFFKFIFHNIKNFINFIIIEYIPSDF